MAIEKIGGKDPAGAIVLTLIGSALTVPDGKRLTVYDVDLSALGSSTLTLESSTDGGATFPTVEGEWHLASAGFLGREYRRGPILNIVGSGTLIQVRLRYIQAVAAQITAFAVGELV